MPLPPRVGVQMTDKTNGNALTTGVTLEVTFDGTNFGAPTNGPSHRKNGWWAVDLTATERLSSDQVEVQGTHVSGVVDTRSFLNVPNPADDNEKLQGEWKFDTGTVTADPGSGRIRYNNATPANVTEIYINENDSQGTNRQIGLQSLGTGDSINIAEFGAANYARFTMNKAAIDNSGWWTLPVAFVENVGTIANNTDVIVQGVGAGVPVVHVIVPTAVSIPASGNNLVSTEIKIFDAQGQPLDVDDFDTTPQLTVAYKNENQTATGGTPTVILRDDVGDYRQTYIIPSANPPEIVYVAVQATIQNIIYRGYASFTVGIVAGAEHYTTARAANLDNLDVASSTLAVDATVAKETAATANRNTITAHVTTEHGTTRTHVTEEIFTTARAQPAQGSPPDSASLGDQIAWMYKLDTNRQHGTGTEEQFYNAAGTVVDSKRTVSESGGEVDKGKILSGP